MTGRATGEPKCFGDRAEHMCGAAALLLGWRPEEFWSATPAELATSLRASEAEAEIPDADTIEQLRRQFPDD